jgi:hypothetical protein
MSRHNDRYEVFIITHIDEDHVGGALSLLDDFNLRDRVPHIWFNGYVHCESGGNVLGPISGEQLTERIVEGPFYWNRQPGAASKPSPFQPPASHEVGGPIVIPSSGDLPCIDLPGNAKIVLLSPTGPTLKALALKWKARAIEAGLVAGKGAPGHTVGPKAKDRVVDPLPDPLNHDRLLNLAKVRKKDSSLTNKSSIAFVLEYDTNRVLFAADAHAPVLAEGLKRYARRIGEPRPRIELVKLAHHGSNKNVSPTLLDLIDCQRFLISTNGDIFSHPDDAAIAKVMTTRPEPVTFYCNYRTVRTAPWEQRGPAVGATFVFPDSEDTVLTGTA